MRSEFDLINNIKKKYSLRNVGDDCAVLPKNDTHDLIITTDMLVEDIDFRLSWTKAEYLGHKTLAVSLSDIAAMGGKPIWAMLSMAVPESLWKGRFLDEFYDGWHNLAGKYGVELVGGDISRSPDKLVIDSIVAGETVKDKAILRSTAMPGDLIFVSGSLGGAAAGLSLLENGKVKEASELILRQLKPEPRNELALQLSAQNIPSAMIDLSDGLSADLGHVCEASGVGAKIYTQRIPVDKNLILAGFTADAALDPALNGGEDFELLFTVNRASKSALAGMDVTNIGEITDETGVVNIIDERGTSTILEAKGFRHF